MPIYALVLITFVVLIFVLIGDVNTLAPIVTTSFLMSYIAVNYAYFALAMSYDKRQQRDLRFGQKTPRKSFDGAIGGVTSDSSKTGYGSTQKTGPYKDSVQNIRTDLDKLFPERLTSRGQHHLVTSQEGSGSPDHTEADFDATNRSKSLDNMSIKKKFITI